MDPQLRIAQEFRIQHRHSDGSWASMDPVPHDAAAHDGERSWLRRVIFRCEACSEDVTLTTAGDEDEPGGEAR
jgi:hypothetical protein